MSGQVQDSALPSTSLGEKISELGSAAAEFARLVPAWLSRNDAPAAKVPKRIVVVAYTAMGDLLFFLPVLEAIRAAWPKAHVTFIGSAYAAAEELLPALGLVDDLWNNSYYDLWKKPHRDAVSRRLAEGNFDMAVIGQATPLRGLARGLLKIPLRAGHVRPIEAKADGWPWLSYKLWQLRRGLARQEFERRLALNRKVLLDPAEHSVARNLKLVAALGAPVPAPESSRPRLVIPKEAEAFAERMLPTDLARATIGVHVGAPTSGYSKLWPAERWGGAAKSIANGAPARFVVFGGPSEKETAERFAKAYGGEVIDLAGKASLVESFACLRRCSLLLANDTGMSKAAMVLGVPTVTVWGPVDRLGQGAVWDKDRHAEVFRPMACSPCVSMSLPKEGSQVLNFSNCGHHDCLNKLEAAPVVEAALKQLARLRR